MMRTEKDSEFPVDRTNYRSVPSKESNSDKKVDSGEALPKDKNQPRTFAREGGRLPKSGKQLHREEKSKSSLSLLQMAEWLFKPQNPIERIFAAVFVASILLFLAFGLARLVIPAKLVESSVLLKAILAIPAVIATCKAGMWVLRKTGIYREVEKDLKSINGNIGSWFGIQTAWSWLGWFLLWGFIIFLVSAQFRDRGEKSDGEELLDTLDLLQEENDKDKSIERLINQNR